MTSCHFWAWGFRSAKTPGLGNSRHPCRPKAAASMRIFAFRRLRFAKTPGSRNSRPPADRAGSAGLPAPVGRRPHPLIRPSSLSPARTGVPPAPPWRVKSADVGRETGPPGPCFPPDRGRAYSSAPGSSGKTQVRAHPMKYQRGGGNTGENIWNSPPQRTKGTRRRILQAFPPGIFPGPADHAMPGRSSLAPAPAGDVMPGGQIQPIDRGFLCF
jgi:hypothetical protein